jgi:hypothetical protein
MIAKAAQTAEWKAYLADNYRTYTFQRSGESARYLGPRNTKQPAVRSSISAWRKAK